jgi:CBS domain-containing protein
MTVGEICTRKVIIAPRNTSAYEAAKLMRQHHTGDVVVTDDSGDFRTPVGIVTDRDLVLEVVAQGLNPAEVTVGEMMSDSPVTACERDGVFETVRQMRSTGVRRIPVVDSTNSLMGIVSLDDVLELMAEEMGDLANAMRQERMNEMQSRQ